MHHIDLTKVIGFGVAGNFAGHLEQAGEASDFTKVQVKEACAPKAMFPFYLPQAIGNTTPKFLGVYPLTSDKLTAPKGEGDNLQIEPEIGLLCRICYNGDEVASLAPIYFGAYNDSSIRRQGARKISEKKNWGANTKGFSQNVIAVDNFTKAGILEHYHIACFLKRDGECIAYGVDSAAADYNYMYEKLIAWMVEKLNGQKDEGPAEDIHSYLLACGRPEYTLISIGATRYTEFGQSHYLKKGDISYVVVYPDSYSPDEIASLVKDDNFADLKISVLRQEVI